MKLHARFILIAIALLFASSAHGQLTIWLPTGGGTADYSTVGNWTNGLPNIALHVSAGADSNTQHALIQTASTAVVTATAATADALWVGYGVSTSSGLRVESGGTLTVNDLELGVVATSTGNATVTDMGSKITSSTFSTYAAIVGIDGTGSLTISNGGAIEGGLSVGFNSGATGTVLVTGNGSSVSSGITGNSGTAHITVTDHASVDFIYGSQGASGHTDITISDSASVSASVSGGTGTTTITVDNASVGGDVSGASGTTTITVTNNASVGGGVNGSDGTTHITISNGATVSGGLSTGSGDTDITMDSGATLTSGGINLTSAGTGTITIDSSSHTLDSNIYVSGTGSNTLTLQSNASVDGSSAGLIVGDADGESGTLNITSGATLTAGGAYIGNQTGSHGEVTISGTNSTLNVASELDVGGDGVGNLTVSSAGSLYTGSDAYVGWTGNGSVTVTGTGSQWTSGGDVRLASNHNSSGSITLTDGGQLTIHDGSGTLYLNTEAGGFGFLNIGADAGSSPGAPGYLTAATVTGSGANGGSAVLVFNHTGDAGTPYFFDPQISGGTFVVQKHGTTVLTNGANDYNGGTTIMGGTLAVGNTNALGTGDINFDGGTLDLNVQSQDSGAGRLNVLSNSFIDFSAFGSSTLILADSSGITWSGTLTLLNFDGGDAFRVGTNADGLTGTQLSLIDIDGYIAAIDGDGYLSMSGTAFVAPAVPEPSTYAALAGLAALGFAAYRRRKTIVVARY